VEIRPESRVAAEAVDRVLTLAWQAVEAVGSRTQEQVRQIVVDREARVAEEARSRRERLGRLRVELSERAAALAGSYQAILEQLAAVEAALGHEAPGQEQRQEPAQTQVAAVKMTLRERQRFDFAADAPARLPPPPAIEAPVGRRRRWLPWHREAA
jgi:hypothetical protein